MGIDHRANGKIPERMTWSWCSSILGGVALAEVLQKKLIALGIHPVLRLSATAPMELNLLGGGNDSQLVFQAPGTKELYRIFMGASTFMHRNHLPTSKTSIQHVSVRCSRLASRCGIFFSSGKSRARSAGTLCTLPTAALAKHAKLSVKEYTNQIIKACYLNRPDPRKAWEEVYKDAQDIKKWLNGMKVAWFQVESKNIDLTVTPGDRRKWIGISGHNIPSFELFVSPDWRGTEGTYFANQPSYRSGNYVKEVMLTFKKGSLVNVKAATGEEFARKQFALDNGANKVGEFSLTDKRFSKIDRFMANTLFDENYGGKYGNCHVALGSSYSDTFAGDPSKLTAANEGRSSGSTIRPCIGIW